jgi:hypothetical protein
MIRRFDSADLSSCASSSASVIRSFLPLDPFLPFLLLATTEPVKIENGEYEYE